MNEATPTTRRDWLRTTTAAALAAGLATGSRPIPAEDEPAGDDPINSLRVLTFNILVGGTRFEPLAQTAKVIASSGADVIGLQEVAGSGPELARMTGFHRFAHGSTQILSRFPVVGHTPHKRGVKIDVPGRGIVWMFNDHLAPAPYQPYQLAGIPYGAGNPFIETAGEAIAEAIRARGSQLAALLMEMSEPLRSGAPIIVTGDFNEPSHLDWTARAAKAGLHALPVPWPTSRCLADAGLVDTYRAVHANEVQRPGFTWTPRPGEREVHDRIDLIYTRGLVPRAAAVVGEATEHADIVVTPYPSDHRAVVATLAWPNLPAGKATP